MVDVWTMKVHPAADIFPMLAADELAELAADIKVNGLVHPLVIKGDLLIDGRNRREACRVAGIKPETVELNGADPVAYILSSNINRRHMTKGQRAMAVAKIYPETAQGKKSTSSASKEVSGVYLSQARAVLKWAPELADAVLAGAEGLDKSYAIAVERKEKAKAPETRLAALRVKDPDLADKVVEDALSLDDAEGASRSRRETERVQRQGIYDGLREIERWMFLFNAGENLNYLLSTMDNYSDELKCDEVAGNIDAWIEQLTYAVGRMRA